jgi:hypothetical protein
MAGNSGNSTAALTAQDYINAITGNTPGFAPLDAPPTPAAAPVTFDDRRNLAVLIRKVADAAEEITRPVADSKDYWCSHCTHRLTETFHMSSSVFGFMTTGIHFTKRHDKLVEAIDALPEGNEKSLARAFEKASLYAYCLQEARMAKKPDLQAALIDVAAKAVGALPEKTEDIKIECAAGTGDFASSGILYQRLTGLQSDLKGQLTQKIEDMKNSNLNAAPVAPPPAPEPQVDTPEPVQVGKPLTLVRKGVQTP